MKIFAMGILVLSLATAANAGVVWDESVNGPISPNPATPTPIVLSVGSNFIIGSVTNISPPNPRDVITFTIPAGHTLTSIILHAWGGGNTGFSAINAGTTSVVPANPNIDFWMAGIHVDATFIDTDLLDAMRDHSVTTQNLDASQLDPGDYCYLIQQTSPVLANYSLEFILQGPVATEPTTWGSIKALYR
jgi:hypothetical protein